MVKLVSGSINIVLQKHIVTNQTREKNSIVYKKLAPLIIPVLVVN